MKIIIKNDTYIKTKEIFQLYYRYIYIDLHNCLYLTKIRIRMIQFQLLHFDSFLNIKSIHKDGFLDIKTCYDRKYFDNFRILERTYTCI